MPEPFDITVGAEAANTRLDVFLASVLPGVSRARIQKAITAGHVRVNGSEVPPRTLLHPADHILGDIAAESTWSVEAEHIPFTVLHHDACLAVINKPRGLAVHPGAGRRSGTLVNALAARFGTLPGGSSPERPGIVHRLDKDTSGLMIVALDAATMTALGQMIASREVERRYMALVWGNPAFNEAVVDAHIGRDPRHPERMAVLPEASAHTKRQAITELTVRERFAEAALIEAKLKTGRTHQIRVHCAYAGHPLMGDTVYGERALVRKGFPREGRAELAAVLERLQGQALHAWSLRFRHPGTGEAMSFECEPPPEMQDVVDFLRQWAHQRHT